MQKLKYTAVFSIFIFLCLHFKHQNMRNTELTSIDEQHIAPSMMSLTGSRIIIDKNFDIRRE